MTVSSDIVLYELIGRAEDAGKVPNFSPHVWKTKFDLAVLGIAYKPTGQSFHQIRGNLAEQTGNDKVTVPTLVDAGKTITDSWDIAEYLEDKYAKPAGKSLFGGSDGGKALAKFIDGWANTTLAGDLRPLIGPKVYLSLDPPSTEYFLSPRKTNQTRERAEELVSLLSDPSYTSPHIAAARAKLSVVESLLAWNASQGKGPWLLGDEPSHADACLWGWYAFSRLNKDTEQVWGHESLPRLGQWVKEVISKGFAKEEELY